MVVLMPKHINRHRGSTSSSVPVCIVNHEHGSECFLCAVLSAYPREKLPDDSEALRNTATAMLLYVPLSLSIPHPVHVSYV